jgi:hypothetical protein
MSVQPAQEQDALLALVCASLAADDCHLADTESLAALVILAVPDGDIPTGIIDLDALPPARCLERFRLNASGIRRAADALGLPLEIRDVRHGYVVGRDEAMCILLRRLASPCRWADLEAEFGRPRSFLCAAFLHMVEWVDERYAANMRLNPIALGPRIRAYADAVARLGAPLETCFGFIDGTVLKVCRPCRYQREAYSGHKRCHCLKFQSVLLPDGIIADLWGPSSGFHNDQHMLNNSGLEERLADAVFDGYTIYGDAGYTYSEHLAVPFRTAAMDEVERAFNDRMAALRISVEWGFARVTQLFSLLSFVPALRIYSSPVAKFYRVAVLLTNMITCISGTSEAATYFGLPLPSLDEYMSEFLVAAQSSGPVIRPHQALRRALTRAGQRTGDSSRRQRRHRTASGSVAAVSPAPRPARVCERRVCSVPGESARGREQSPRVTSLPARDSRPVGGCSMCTGSGASSSRQ